MSPKITETNSPSFAFINPSELIPSEISKVDADKFVIFASLKSKSSKVVILVICALPEGSILLVNLPIYYYYENNYLIKSNYIYIHEF